MYSSNRVYPTELSDQQIILSVNAAARTSAISMCRDQSFSVLLAETLLCFPERV